MLSIIGSVILAAIGFILGKFYAESERIIAEKRKYYVDLLNILPPLQDSYKDTSEEDVMLAMKPAMDRMPGLIFYGDQPVIIAFGVFVQKYYAANESLTPQSPPKAPEYMALAKAQNDLILEMRRDAFRWSIFSYNGKSRLPKESDLPQ